MSPSLQTGKMTLIDKKEPSLEVINKCPLTASRVILSVFTKLLHKRMNIICEREGEVQYGFRKNRSTTDFVFLILAAIRAAKWPTCCLSVLRLPMKERF